MTISVLFPSGAHGHFLTVMLNHALGITTDQNTDQSVFDHPRWIGDPIFKVEHCAKRVANNSCCVQINVPDQDLLRWTVMTMSRTSGKSIDLDDVHRDPWNRFKDHPHIEPLLGSLSTISTQTQGAVPIAQMRDWARLCFFADDCRTLRMILQDSVLPNARLSVDFGDIYRNPIGVVYHILDAFGLRITNTEGLHTHVAKFEQRNRYRHIDLDLHIILDALDQRVNLKFDSGNFVKQAWIDNYLVTRYNVDPLLIDHYWTDTYQLLEAYGLR